MTAILSPECHTLRSSQHIGLLLLSLAVLAGCGEAPTDGDGSWSPSSDATATTAGSSPSESTLGAAPPVAGGQAEPGSASLAPSQDSQDPAIAPAEEQLPGAVEATPPPPAMPLPESPPTTETERDPNEEEADEDADAQSASLVELDTVPEEESEPVAPFPDDSEMPNEEAPDTEALPPSPDDEQGALKPLIPEPMGPCQEFISGQQTIMGLSTEIVAGSPTDAKGPILFNWHGTGGNGAQALAQLPQSVQRDIVARGGIIIAPSTNGQVRAGQDVTSFLRVWYDGADLDYADHIVACAVQNHNIDPRQVYATGCSAGGLMAGVMALKRSSYVAAVAPNSGGIATPADLEDPTRIPAVIAMHGGSGDNVIVNFGDTSQDLFNILAPMDAFLVDCNHNAGHCGASGELYEHAWEFMKAHPFGTEISPFADGLPDEFPDFCEIQ